MPDTQGASQDHRDSNAKRRLGRGLTSLIGRSVPIAAAPGPQQARPAHGGGIGDGPSAAVPSATRQPEQPSEEPSGAEQIATRSAGHGSQTRSNGLSPLEEVQALPLDHIEPNPHQPRQVISPESLRSLADSIRAAGVMQPIVVRPGSATGPSVARFQIVAGERRWRAARLLGLDTIPAIVRSVDDRTAAEWAIVENVQREDLNPMDRAMALRRLVDEFAVSQSELAERLGLDRSTVANMLRLNDLDPFTMKLVREGRLSAGHGRALLGCHDATRRAVLAAAASRGEWSVRRTEQAVAADVARADGGPASARAARGAAPAALHLAALQRRISDALGTRTIIEQGRAKGSGRLILEYYSLEQFEGLLHRLGIAEATLTEV